MTFQEKIFYVLVEQTRSTRRAIMISSILKKLNIVNINVWEIVMTNLEKLANQKFDVQLQDCPIIIKDAIEHLTKLNDAELEIVNDWTYYLQPGLKGWFYLKNLLTNKCDLTKILQEEIAVHKILGEK